MPKIKVTYKSGTWFLVPLRNGGFARGVVVRFDGKGTVFGYFFGPKQDCAAGDVIPTDLKPGDAVLVCRFGDLGLISKKGWRGNWTVIGDDPRFRCQDWPVPPLARVVDGACWLSEYDPDNLKFVREWKGDPSVIGRYPRDGLLGSGAVELVLTKLLQ